MTRDQNYMHFHIHTEWRVHNYVGVSNQTDFIDEVLFCKFMHIRGVKAYFVNCY